MLLQKNLRVKQSRLKRTTFINVLIISLNLKKIADNIQQITDPVENILSPITKQTYDCILPAGTKLLDILSI